MQPMIKNVAHSFYPTGWFNVNKNSIGIQRYNI